MSPESTALRERLLDAQLANVAARRHGWMVVVMGNGCSGRGAAVNHLCEWLDTRHVRVLAWDAQDPRGGERPWLARYWDVLPAKGQGAILFGGWEMDLFKAELEGRGKRRERERAAAEARQFERLFVDEGGVLLKVHLSLDAETQRQRIEAFLAKRSTRYRVQPEDAHELAHPRRYRKAFERLHASSQDGPVPWQVIDASDEAARDIALAEALSRALRAGAAAHAKTTAANEAARAKTTAARKPVRSKTTAAPKPVRAKLEAGEQRVVLHDMTTRLDLSKDDYTAQLPERLLRLGELQRAKSMQDKSLVLVFEGQDAGGKGGAIRRLTMALDARNYRVVPIAAPTVEEKAHPYLWRFWRHVPPRGKMSFFDRSWYGRVLVERVEGFASTAEWQRAYGEIVGFEEQLVQHGAVVLKFWMHLGKDEQAARFAARKSVSYKQYKITDEDLRNRGKWDAYQDAAADMITKTHREHAPWLVIPADNKRHARIAVLDAVIAGLEG